MLRSFALDPNRAPWKIEVHRLVFQKTAPNRKRHQETVRTMPNKTIDSMIWFKMRLTRTNLIEREHQHWQQCDDTSLSSCSQKERQHVSFSTALIWSELKALPLRFTWVFRNWVDPWGPLLWKYVVKPKKITPNGVIRGYFDQMPLLTWIGDINSWQKVCVRD